MNVDEWLSKAYIIEMESVLFYAYLSTEFSNRDLKGFAKFFKTHSQEEYEHAQKILQHLITNKIPISLNISHSDYVYGDDLSTFTWNTLKRSLERETETSNYYKNMMNYIEEKKEYKHQDITLWFIKEQVEEEALFNQLLVK